MTPYEIKAAARAADLIKRRAATILAVETSCDETAAAVVKDGRSVLSNVVYTQIPLHEKYGGVVPEVASRSHVERIGAVVKRALDEADTPLEALDAIAVTYGPGLVGALLVGVNYAKALAYSLGIPLVGVNHIIGHIAANYLSFGELAPPFVCMIASGGHSHIFAVDDYPALRLLGRTRDDAAGEAFDKAARVLGLGYPGGPKLEALARGGNPLAYPFHTDFNQGPGLDMSFSGIKTALVNLVHNAEQKGEALSFADLAAGFEHSVARTLTDKSILAMKQTRYTSLALAGGVSANLTLRETMARAAQREGFAFYCPKLEYCTDNAAMIGCCGYYDLMHAKRSGLALNAHARLALA